MAKASITLTCTVCGKPFTHTKICYNRSLADNYEEWAKDNITMCTGCFLEQKRQQERDRITTKLHDYNCPELPELSGSEKQIKWAIDIRNNALAEVIHKKPNADFWRLINLLTSARWWIDHEYECNDMYSFAKLLQKERDNI